MAKPVQDDFNGSLLNPQDDTIYGLTVTKRGIGTDGKRQLLKIDFDMGHDSFMELVGSKIEGKKIAKRWQTYIPPTEAEKAQGKKGTWTKPGAVV